MISKDWLNIYISLCYLKLYSQESELWGNDTTAITFSKLTAVTDLFRFKLLQENTQEPKRKWIAVKGPESEVYNHHLHRLCSGLSHLDL